MLFEALPNGRCLVCGFVELPSTGTNSRQGLPVILWAALLINAPLLIVFTYIFSVKNLLVHMVLVATLTLVVASMIFTIRSLEYPFSGDLIVEPTSMEFVLEGFKANSEQ